MALDLDERPDQRLNDSLDPATRNTSSPDGSGGEQGGFYNNSTAASPSQLGAAESAGNGSNSATNSAGSDSLGSEAGLSNDEKDSSKRKLFWNRRRGGIAGGLIVALLGGGAFIGIPSIGTFEFIHAAQILQQLHLQKNEDFGDQRGSHALLYSLLGKSNRSRLGSNPGLNKAADVWEKRLETKTGLKPIYSSITNRFVGFEIKDLNKAIDSLGNIDTGHDAANFGQGAETKTVTEATAKKQGLVTTHGEALASDAHIIDLRGVGFSDRRLFIKTIGKQTGTYKLVSSMASRLLIKRGGVDFHPLKNKIREKSDTFADWVKQRRDEKATSDRQGVQEGSVTADSSTDKNGKPNATPEDTSAANSSSQVIKDAAATPGKDAVKSLVGKLSGKGSVILGVLCSAKSFGNNIKDFKYTNDILPMIRLGMGVVTEGNQVMSGKGLNMDELAADSKQFYDPGTKTSFFDATSIRAGLGQDTKGSVGIPKEASLKDIGKKPAVFNAIDSVPGLGTSCQVSDSIGSLPVIKQVTDGASQIIQGGLDIALKPFGLSTKQLLEDALSIASGQSVNLLAQGGEFGALADTGVFLAANDSAMSMGGVAMSATATAELQNQVDANQVQDKQYASIADRYLNPGDYSSLMGSMIDRVPTSTTQFADSFASPIKNFGSSISALFGSFIPKVRAAPEPYDYGQPTFGFTLAEQQDKRFENPDDNGAIVEPMLPSLNDKYGDCFGMTVTADDSGVHVVSADMTQTDKLNQIKIASKPECHDGSEDLLRYRFYLADAVSGSTLECSLINDPTACANVGFGSDSASPAPAPPSSTPGAYKNPLRDIKNIIPERIDGGVDYNGNDGPIYAIGNGKVVGVRTTGSGWPGLGTTNNGAYIIYQLTDGPANGKFIYMAEDCTPLVKADDLVTADTKICNYHAQIVPAWGKVTAMEMGWSDGKYEYITNDYKSSGGADYASNSGQDFSKFLSSSLVGAPPGIVKGTKSTVPMPAGWPTW